MSVWISMLTCQYGCTAFNACRYLFYFSFLRFSSFVKSNNIVLLRKVYPKFFVWCFASYVFDWRAMCAFFLYLFIYLVFVDCCWSSFMQFNHYHYFANASPVKRNAFGVGRVGSVHKWAQILIYLQFSLSISLWLSGSFTLLFFFLS